MNSTRIPADQKIDTARLSQVFNNTSATYKFFWFISILEIYVATGNSRITFREIVARMVANAWYPIHYFLLSFGQQDSLFEKCKLLQHCYSIRIDEDKNKVQKKVLGLFNDRVANTHLDVFQLNVPYRFLSPWIPFLNNPDLIARSQQFENGCPYQILDVPEKSIEINPIWCDYLQDNVKILLDYCYWNLACYLQKKNPNVPDIPNKLIRPIERNSLAKQREFWDVVISESGGMRCIYTGKPLTIGDFDVDHFIPWSFVAHNLIWNLVPSDKSINCSKNNKLPDLENYLRPFADRQRSGLTIIHRIQPNNKLLEDFTCLGYSISDLLNLRDEDFYHVFQKSISPLAQIAENMGFEPWRYVRGN